MEQNLKTINIKGKEYVEVNQRINYFRTNEAYAGWSMETEIVSMTDTSCVFKAIIKDTTGRVIATGLAQEDKDSSLVNETSFIENCETSAWGRALANLGIGVATSVASADEVNTAIRRQDNNRSQSATQQYQQQYQEETRVFSLPLDGNMYDVEYVKKYNRKQDKYFWALRNPEDSQFFPKYQNFEG